MIRGQDVNNSNSKWFVLIGSQKYGPYDYPTIVEMIQNNQLMDFNYLWADHLKDWTPIYQLEEFRKEHFRKFVADDLNLKNVFIKRKSNRISKNIPFSAHNSIRFFEGQIVSISEYGALCLIECPIVQVGDKLKMQIKDELETARSFNIEAEIIRKNISKKGTNGKSEVFYSIQFSEDQFLGIVQIKEWLKKLSA
jgi:hypothetical protein